MKRERGTILNIKSATVSATVDGLLIPIATEFLTK